MNTFGLKYTQINSLHKENCKHSISYIEAGQGEPIILLHGVGLRAEFWCLQIEELAKIGRVIAPDMPGHGSSDLLICQNGESPLLGDYTKWLKQFIDSLGITSCTIIGHSMGALVARDLAINHPEIVSGLAELNSVYQRNTEQREAVLARAKNYADAVSNNDKIDYDTTLCRWFDETPLPSLVPFASWISGMLQSGNKLGYSQVYNAFANAEDPQVEQLENIDCSCVAITGSDDLGSTPLMARQLITNLNNIKNQQNNTAIVLEGHRHLMPITAASDVNKLLVNFVSESINKNSAIKDNKSMQKGEGTSFDSGGFRSALGTFLTGVTLVTTCDENGDPVGFTANSFASVSLDPPLISFCIAKTAHSFAAFINADNFAISVLAQEQKALSVMFASPVPGRFDAAEWSAGKSGSPILKQGVAWFDCQKYACYEAGDHYIVIGKVIDLNHQPSTALGYYRGNYINFGLSAEAISSRHSLKIGAILEYKQTILFEQSANGELQIPTARKLGTADEEGALNQKLTELKLKYELGPLFSVYQDEGNEHNKCLIFYRGQLAEQPVCRNNIVMINSGEIPWDKIIDLPMKSMVKRFVEERQQSRFGVYYGNHAQGKVHLLKA